jgi:phospholipase/carboxylesterase
MDIDSYIHAEKPAARAGAPLVFTFHGTGGDETQFLALAEQIWPGGHVVSPRGDVSEHGAARFFRRRAEGVYDFDDLKTRTRAMAAFVRAHKARVGPKRVIGLGYSNGANILAAVVFENPYIFDDIALMHPLVPWTPADDPRLASHRVLITAGRRDPICPPELTRALKDYFERQGADVTLDWHDGGHEIRQTEIEAVARAFGGA